MEKFTDAVIQAIESHGMKKGFVAKKLGISRQALYLKLDGRSRWSADDVAILTKLLDIPIDLWLDRAAPELPK